MIFRASPCILPIYVFCRHRVTGQ
jgi:hypothetical protein